ncbi:MAG: hypothetical protein ACOC3T_04670 [Bacteroidota bacterium]
MAKKPIVIRNPTYSFPYVSAYQKLKVKPPKSATSKTTVRSSIEDKKTEPTLLNFSAMTSLEKATCLVRYDLDNSLIFATESVIMLPILNIRFDKKRVEVQALVFR